MKERFGEFEGETVWKWTMVNDHGMRMSVLNYGAIVTSLETKDKFGDFANISLGFTNLDDYLAHSHTSARHLALLLDALQMGNLVWTVNNFN